MTASKLNIGLACGGLLLAWGIGCASKPAAMLPAIDTLPPPLAATDVSVPSRPTPAVDPVRLRTVRGGWAQVVLTVQAAGASGHPMLRLPGAVWSAASAINVYQVLPAPVDFDTAEFVRQSGQVGAVRSVPRVLLTLPVTADGLVDLSTARDPDRPTMPAPPGVRGPLLVWVEFCTKATAPAAAATGTCDLLDGPAGEVLGSVPVTVDVADVTLADADRLRVTAELDWPAAVRADPAAFAGVVPRLLHRGDPAAAAVLADLDGYERAAHENGASLSIDGVQPIVKWPPNRPPAVDWADFDTVAGPWLDGSAFDDRRPAGYWPLPAPDSLDEFDLKARGDYRAVAADYFEARHWTAANACPVVLHAGAVGLTDARLIELSAEARATLDGSATVRVLVPARSDQVPLASAENRSLVTPGTGDRLVVRAAGGVRPAGADAWPPRSPVPERYLDLADPLVLHGTGDEQDVRSAAWLASLRGATSLACGRPLPSTASAEQPVPADELPWFYPGVWYGVRDPLPTIQLKWLRQAAQDYAVLRQTAAVDPQTATAVCRLVAKPVDVGPPTGESSVVSLLGGTTERHAIDDTRNLLIDRLASRGRAAAGTTAVGNRSVRWFAEHQRPTPFATAVRWTWADVDPSELAGRATEPTPPGPGHWITARVDVDVYDPAEPPPAEPGPRSDDPDGSPPATWRGDVLRWQTAGAWESRPIQSYVPRVPACGVRSCPAVARFNLDAAGPADPRSPTAATLALVDPDRQATACPLVLPVATSTRLTRDVELDGKLDDWSAADAAWLDRPLTRMADRPAVQAAEARPADAPTTLYTGWTDADLYVAFRVVTGVRRPTTVQATRTFPVYQDGRAWGEDVCDLTVQPVYADDTVGQPVHVVCKTGSEWSERQSPGGGWVPFEGAALRYAATVDPTDGVWRGELAIPWSAVAAAGRGRPTLLRFNFGQHVAATGESATWAGPVDRSRAIAMAGLLVLRDGAVAAAN